MVTFNLDEYLGLLLSIRKVSFYMHSRFLIISISTKNIHILSGVAEMLSKFVGSMIKIKDAGGIVQILGLGLLATSVLEPGSFKNSDTFNGLTEETIIL